MKIVTIKDLIEYRLQKESLIEKEVNDIKLPTNFGDFDLQLYSQITNGQLHLALVKGQWIKTNRF